VVEQVRVLAREIRDQKLPIFSELRRPHRDRGRDPIVRVAEEVGIPIEAATFIGSSRSGKYAEDWTLDRILTATEEAVSYAVKHGLPVMYVTEDTTRAKPEGPQGAVRRGDRLRRDADMLGGYGRSCDAGRRQGVSQIRQAEIVKQHRVKIDWHGHRDRGLGLINCLAAIEAGSIVSTPPRWVWANGWATLKWIS